jgi:carboxyl-terminal processing protease
MMAITEAQRRTIFEKVLSTVDAKFMGGDPDTKKMRVEHEAEIVRAQTSDDFEQAMNAMLKQLGTSHTGFFHEKRPRAASRIAIAATLTKAQTTDGVRWMFQDVHRGGVAAQAGIQSGDVLLKVGAKELVPPEAMPFVLGETYSFTVRRADGSISNPTLTIPGSKEKQRPIVVPDQVVNASRLPDGTGLIRVSMFPGVLGMDVARDISRAITELGCHRLVIDLRGNTGGGIGCLRVMSQLCPDRRGVGYSVSRDVARRGFEKERLPAFDRIPKTKLGVIPLIFRFARARRSVAVFTEALGQQPHHGRVAMLVNEHSASAAEMVAAFASENRLATLIGVKTPGRLVATSAFKVGLGYRVVLPVAAYFTWNGTNLEGCGLAPDIEEPLSPEAVWSGEDNQLTKAIQLLKSPGGAGLASAASSRL